jgi:dTDP-4-amino-4,6-dideoxygalactose transaminase
MIGSLGTFGCFSFFPTKNLGAIGDAGLISTSDAAQADSLRVLRAHGSRQKYLHEVVGTNSRLDALQAAVLRLKLGHLASWQERRIAHARAYDQSLAGLDRIVTPAVGAGDVHVYHQYTIRVTAGARDRLRDFLAARGIGATVYYPVPLHRQPALASLSYKADDFPETERAAAEVLSLPMFPELTAGERDRVIDAIRAFARSE